MSAAPRHAADRRQVEGADPVRRGQRRGHPLQRPAEQAGRHLQHGAGLGPAGAGARRAGDTAGVSGGAGAGGIRPHGQLPGTAAHFGAAQRLGRGQDVSFRLDKYRNLSARYIIFHKLQWEL